MLQFFPSETDRKGPRYWMTNQESIRLANFQIYCHISQNPKLAWCNTGSPY